MIWLIPYLGVLGVLFAYFVLMFVLAVLVKRNDIADVAWGLGFILVAAVSFWMTIPEIKAREVILLGLVALWGIRLAWHIHLRNKGKDEDFRYKAWRKQWGKYFLVRSFLQVFMLQGALLFIIALPIMGSMFSSTEKLIWLDFVGIVVWIIGFCFESISDYQLLKFVKDKDSKGKILKSGLWQYSRHPNYFGEVTMWWGIFWIAFAGNGAWFMIVGPALITFLILFVSGVPLLEKKYKGNKEYELYKQKTSIFIPWFPKK